MSTQVVPHLNFRGQARAALEFYQTVFGGNLMVVTYEEMGNVQDPGDAQLVMWGQVAADGGFKVMAFDAAAKMPFDLGQNAFYVAVRFNSTEEAQVSWAKLTSGASVRRELAPAPWGAPLYGMVQDKFGIIWIVDVETQHQPS